MNESPSIASRVASPIASQIASPIEERVAGLRRAFDDAFASESSPADADVEDVLLVRVAGHPYAVPATDVGGVARGRSIVPVPSRRPELVGLAGIRGTVVCVYGMASLLGLAEDGASTGWLLLVGDAEPVALAFQALDGFVRVPRAALHEAVIDRAALAPASTRLVKGVLRTATAARPILDLHAALESIRNQAGAPASRRSGP